MTLTAFGLPDPDRDAQFYAGTSPRRLLAFVVDSAAIAALALAVTLLETLLTLGFGLLLAIPIWLVTAFLYRWRSIALWSATPGMLLAGVELRDARGEPLGEAQAAAHTAMFFAVCFFAIPQLIGLALMASRADGRGLHDLATGAALINRPA